MLSIKLARYGKKHQPVYRIVVIDSRKVATSEYLEVIGHYNPRTEPSTFDLNQERMSFWMKRGAQPSGTVAKLARIQTTAKPADASAEAAPAKKAPAKKKAAAKKAE